MSDTDFIPEGAVVLSKIEIVEYLDAETGEYLIAERYWTADEPLRVSRRMAESQ